MPSAPRPREAAHTAGDAGAATNGATPGAGGSGPAARDTAAPDTAVPDTAAPGVAAPNGAAWPQPGPASPVPLTAWPAAPAGDPAAGMYPQPTYPLQQAPAPSAPAPKPPHKWGLGAYLVVEVVFLLASFVVGRFLLSDVPTAGQLAVAVGLPTVLAAATALLITRLRGNGPLIDLGLEWSWRDLGLGLAFGFGGLALTIPASIIYVAIVGADTTSAVGEVFGGLTAAPAMAVVVFLIVVFVAPLCEEIVYRGLLWGGVERLGGRWVAFGVTTLLFALAHFEFTRTPLLFVVAIPIAVARLYTGRLLASIVAHQVNNLLPGIALLLGLLGVVPLA